MTFFCNYAEAGMDARHSGSTIHFNNSTLLFFRAFSIVRYFAGVNNGPVPGFYSPGISGNKDKY